jgi:putative membrane protein
LFFPSAEGFAIGVSLGFGLFCVNFVVDFIISKFLKDPIFVLRRTLVLSLFSWVFWLLFIIIGAILGEFFGFVFWIKLCLLGFATLITLRSVVFFSVSSANLGRRLFAILAQPFACVILFVLFWIYRGITPLDYVPFILLSPVVGVLSAAFFISILDKIGQKAYNVPSINVFKAFMLNWVAALNTPLEGFLERMGGDTDVEVSVLKFASTNNKATIIVPLVHPGPFKNIGSSVLPSLLKREFEKAYGGDACVPLGLLGHELDAASQVQNHKIVDQVIRSSGIEPSIDVASPFVRVSNGFVSASCQVFGKIAFLSFTLSPRTTEDLPQELSVIVREEAAKLGFESAVVVNAHNSLTGNPEIEASLETLREVASKSLQKAASMSCGRFEVGSATLRPSEYTLKEGMGDGGITTLVVKVLDQKIAYVVVDGNNMVSGLREELLSALSVAGFEGEIFTTDTHAVSAVVVGRRGYHPVGEAMDHGRFIEYVKEVLVTAESRLEGCKAGYVRLVVPNVRVIGSDCLESISLLVDKTIQRAKQILVPIFAAEGLLLILFLAFL